MSSTIFTEHVVSVSELKADPKKALAEGNGQPIAVLCHNKPIFYCVTPEFMEIMLDALDDIELYNKLKGKK